LAPKKLGPEKIIPEKIIHGGAARRE